MKLFTLLLFVPFTSLFFNFEAIETNDTSKALIESTSQEIEKNPFEKFIGKWVMKDNKVTSTFDGKTNTIINKNRRIIVREMNTKTSIIWIDDLGKIESQNYWTYDSNYKEIHFLSSNSKGDGAIGRGQIDKNGNVEFKLNFHSECAKCYQLFTYQWISDDEILFKATDYLHEKATGNSFGFTLIRKK